MRKLVLDALVCAVSFLALAQPALAQETGLPTIPTDEGQTLAAQSTITVTEFRFEGNSVFTDEQLLQAPVTIELPPQETDQPAAAPVEAVVRTRVRDYHNKELTTEDLEQIRQAVTRLYVGQGFINSGAVLPDQTVDGGVIAYKVVEGKLTDVNLEYRDRNDALKPVKGRLRREYVVSRVRRGAKPPLNIIRLRNQLEVLRQNPNLSRVNAELRPGTEPGEAY